MAVTGGTPQPRPDQQWRTPPPATVAPGGAAGTLRARILFIYGTGIVGIFEYSGTPGPGNNPVAYSTPPGVTTDPYGNALPSTTGGFVSWESGLNKWAQLTSGALSLDSGANTNAGGIQVGNGTLYLNSPAVSDTTMNMQLMSSSQSGAGVPLVLLENGFIVPVDPATAQLPETWHAITLDAGWSTSSGQPVPSVRLLPDGRVALAGYATHASFSGSLGIGTITSGYWPATQQRIANSYGGGIVISTSGTVEAFSAPAGTTDVGFSGAYPLDL